MRIANSNVAMASQRSYIENAKQSIQSFSMINRSKTTANSGSWADVLSLSQGKEDGSAAISETYDRNHGVRGLGQIGDGQSFNISDLRNSLLKQILERLSMSGFDGTQATGLNAGTIGIFAASGGGTMSVSEVSYHEAEYTSFSAAGSAVTEDGRQLDFGIDIEMSRSFTMYTQTQIQMLPSVFMDPLVVNIGGSGVASISDQKFKFDLDADGTMEEISMPTKGSAFLALDLNEDGIINDGSELFGTKSGDGFYDLSQYDSDGNGWIDENDDVFERLKVWYKDEDGKDVLMNLKEADIGAIFLGEQSSEFSLKGADMATHGKIRSTGIFLHESTGAAGTIQHVDLATDAKSPLADGASVYATEDGDDVIAVKDGGTVTKRADNSAQAERTRRRRERENREAEETRRRERRLKKKQEEKMRMEKRAEEKERLEELHEKQRIRHEAETERIAEHRRENRAKENEASEEIDEMFIEPVSEAAEVGMEMAS